MIDDEQQEKGMGFQELEETTADGSHHDENQKSRNTILVTTSADSSQLFFHRINPFSSFFVELKLCL